MSADRRVIPIAPAAAASSDDAPEGACSGAESFALRVLGDSMSPEFEEGDIIVIEPDGLATDGAFVLAHAGGEWIFRQLAATGTGWELRALAPGHAPIALADLAAVKKTEFAAVYFDSVLVEAKNKRTHRRTRFLTATEIKRIRNYFLSGPGKPRVV